MPLTSRIIFNDESIQLTGVYIIVEATLGAAANKYIAVVIGCCGEGNIVAAGAKLCIPNALAIAREFCQDDIGAAKARVVGDGAGGKSC